MKKRTVLFLSIWLFTLCVFAQKNSNEPATVIITAGQSNTDGRVLNTQLPDYIQKNKYTYCQWCYGSAGKRKYPCGAGLPSGRFDGERATGGGAREDETLLAHHHDPAGLH